MHVMIYLLDLLRHFKQKSCDGNLPPYANSKVIAQSQSFSKKNRIHKESFTFSTVAIDMHRKLAQGFFNWE